MEKPDPIKCHGGTLRTEYGELRCDACGAVPSTDPEEVKLFKEGEPCPRKGKIKDLYLRRIDHYRYHNVYGTLEQLRDDKTLVNIKRSSGKIQLVTILEVEYYHVNTEWFDKERGKKLYKRVEFGKFIDNNPDLFAHIEDPKGPTE